MKIENAGLVVTHNHTEGPWRTPGIDAHCNCQIVSEKTGQTVGYFGHTGAFSNRAGDCALITAAPCLLTALEKAVNIVQAYNRLTGKGADTCAEMCAAIAKAKGE